MTKTHSAFIDGFCSLLEKQGHDVHITRGLLETAQDQYDSCCMVIKQAEEQDPNYRIKLVSAILKTAELTAEDKQYITGLMKNAFLNKLLPDPNSPERLARQTPSNPTGNPVVHGITQAGNFVKGVGNSVRNAFSSNNQIEQNNNNTSTPNNEQQPAAVGAANVPDSSETQTATAKPLSREQISGIVDILHPAAKGTSFAPLATTAHNISKNIGTAGWGSGILGAVPGGLIGLLLGSIFKNPAIGALLGAALGFGGGFAYERGMLDPLLSGNKANYRFGNVLGQQKTYDARSSVTDYLKNLTASNSQAPASTDKRSIADRLIQQGLPADRIKEILSVAR